MRRPAASVDESSGGCDSIPDADVALPTFFEALPGLALAGDPPFAGWAFRGLVEMPVTWEV